MKLKTSYEQQTDIPAGYEDLFTERNGKWELTEVEGIKTAEDVNRLSTSLTAERTAHKATKQKFAPLGERPVDEIVADLDKIEEYKLAASNAPDDKKLESIVETRIKSKLAPVERERDQLRVQLTERDTTIRTYQEKDRSRTIRDHVVRAATGAKLLTEAVDDAVMLAERLFDIDESGAVVTRDNVGVTPGIAPEAWLIDLKDKKPHWYGETVGGGARGSRNGGSNGPNPFTDENWNMTEQGKLVKTDPVKAAQLAKAAGTTIGGPRPALRK
mgnify:CR=1 FL=1